MAAGLEILALTSSAPRRAPTAGSNVSALSAPTAVAVMPANRSTVWVRVSSVASTPTASAHRRASARTRASDVTGAPPR